MSKFDKIVYVCIGLILSSCTLFMSCAGSGSNGPVVPVAPEINHTNQDLKQATDTIKDTTVKISDNAQKGLDKTPPTARVALEPHWRAILIQAGIQDIVIKDLEQSQVDLTATSIKAKNLETAYQKEQELRKKAESNATKELQEKYMWVSIACFSVLVISIVLAMSGLGGGSLSKIAMGAAVASGIGLVVSIALVQTVALIPWIVGGIALVGGGIVVYRVIHKNKTIKTTQAVVEDTASKLSVASEENNKLEQSAKELVQVAESAKPFMSLNGRKAVYGDGPIPGIARQITSEHTRKLVSRVRATMDNVAPSIPETIASDMMSHVEESSTEAAIEVMNQKSDTKSVRSRRLTTMKAGSGTVIVLR